MYLVFYRIPRHMIIVQVETKYTYTFKDINTHRIFYAHPLQTPFFLGLVLAWTYGGIFLTGATAALPLLSEKLMALPKCLIQKP